MKILIADDDKDIRKIISVYLKSEGYEVIEAENGRQAVELATSEVSLVLLDVMMPEMDGMDACVRIRRRQTMPILFLTAKTEDIDKIAGFTSGADDYITKPFNPMELVARVKANLRRYTAYQASSNETQSNKKIITVGDLMLDLDGHIVTKNGNEVSLTKTEFGILELLASNRGRVYNLEQIYEKVWGAECFLNTENTVSVHIKKLREKIENDIKKPKYVKTVWGVGYRVD